MPCIICGSSETVEAHLVPRGLVRRVAGENQHALRGQMDKAGYRLDGKGIFDRDLLCAAHEDRFRLSDDYGQRFLDSFERRGTLSADGRLWSVPNRKPTLLGRFVASCIWRCAVSNRSGSAPLNLGPWQEKLRSYLFDEGNSWTPLLLLSRQKMLVDGKPIAGNLLTMPFKAPGLGRRTYGFQFGSCVMMLILDERRERRGLERYGAQISHPALAFQLDDIDCASEPIIQQA